MIEALRELYKAQISVAQVEIMAEAEDKLAVLDKHNY